MIASFSGVVIDGNKRGRLIGYPTINISLDKDNFEDGVYVFSVQLLDGKTYFGMGTCMLGRKLFEGYIFDFDGDLYGQELLVTLLYKLRNNLKFESSNELVEQLEKDEIASRKFLSLS